ncbi:hypothetical protein MON38_16510 [Hymenobacter sp. DH14]|uniref:Uncharacterized protein n=1 Tax=Hymenobacter cyanobacteriorum TaxID=2926463 RepID=A0A9X1VHS3_9BACT|nr:hypothetical protein [Hymenobacter cyanobacteriorum]MCI1189027.1 hypothetical protein [Hymenobacter cyanobacteriorum]
MKNSLDRKLERISNIWNSYIWEYKFCNSRIKFTSDVKSNYFGDITGYFSDTFGLIYYDSKPEESSESKFTQSIGSAISFLQAIYVQQDFVEELLHIFKCDIDKGDLKQDRNYYLNRNIRNELVGHPIRKQVVDGESRLLSSVIFSNSNSDSTIAYLRYHSDDNYKFKEITHSRKEIIERHSNFLNLYFDKIINKLKHILRDFRKKIVQVEVAAEKGTFASIVKFVEDSFENIVKTNYLYDRPGLMRAFELKDKHIRYKNLTEIFLDDLKQSINDIKIDIDEQLADKDRTNVDYSANNYIVPKIKIVLARKGNKAKKSEPISYHYELGKLVERRGFQEFEMFSSFLKNKCIGNAAVLDELDNMRSCYSDMFEYYCSYYYIDKLLSNK